MGSTSPIRSAIDVSGSLPIAVVKPASTAEVAEVVEDRRLGLVARLRPTGAVEDEAVVVDPRRDIGVYLEVAKKNDQLVVVTPIEDTPAWRAGIKAGDYITHLDGQLLYGLDLDEAVEKMRGAPGSSGIGGWMIASLLWVEATKVM